MSILKNVATVGAATIVSRILGFVRDAMIASVLGTGLVADAFVVAFRLPNLIRRLFAEGSFNTVFVPLYARRLADEGEAGAARFARDVTSILAPVVCLVTLLAIVLSPWLVQALAVGFGVGTPKYDLTVTLTRLCFPYLAAMSLAGLLGGILAANRQFLVPALAPVMLNLVLVSVLLAITWSGLALSSLAGLALAAGVTVAGLCQLTLVAVGVARAGFGFRPGRPRLTPDVRQLMHLALPGMLAGGVTQINIVIGTTIASLQAGAVSYLYYADRVYQLPLGVVGIAIGLVLLPEIVHHIRRDRDDLALDSQNRSLEFAGLLIIPATIGLLVAAHPVVEVLFERGAFGPRDTDMTAEALEAYACGLPAFVMVKIFAPAYFARLDMHTPMWIGIGAMLVNVALSLVLFPRFGHVGIALGTTVAGWMNAGTLWWILMRRGEWRADGALETRLPRMFVAGLVMGAAVWLAGRGLDGWLGAENLLAVKIAALAGLVGGGVGVFALMALWLGAVDTAAILRATRRSAPAEPAVPDIPID